MSWRDPPAWPLPGGAPRGACPAGCRSLPVLSPGPTGIKFAVGDEPMEERYAGGRHRLDGAVAGACNIVVLLRILDRECYIDGTAEVGDTEGRVAMRDIEVVDRGDQVEVRVEDVDGSVVVVSGE